MEWFQVFISLIVGIVGGSFGGSIMNSILKMKEKKFDANYERKVSRYTHITAMIELYLYTEDMLDSIQMDMWDVKSISIEENKERAWKTIRINKRQLAFLTENDKVLDAYEQFLNDPDEMHYQQIIRTMRKDLWGK